MERIIARSAPLQSPPMRSRLLAVCVLALACSRAPARTFDARVVKVADGDSFTVRDPAGKRIDIRLSGIDAPEGRQRFGAESKASLERILGGRDVTVDVADVDPYGRLVSRVTRDGRDAALLQLQAGMAWTYPWAEGMPRMTKDRYLAAERTAKSTRAGLWSDAAPVAPWRFRREARRTPAPAAASLAGPVVGNRRSRLYHLPHCPGYAATSAGNRVAFATPAEAEKAGYRRAGNCR